MAGKDDAAKSKASSAKPEDSKNKGKERAVEPTEDGKEKSDKDAKLDLPEEELSEEDQKLKDELEMLVERLLEKDTKLYKPALEQIKEFIKTSTSSMTAVPKPLKFLRPHYEKLVEAYETWPNGENKVRGHAWTIMTLC